MAGHIQDRWYKTESGSDGKPRRVRTDRYGSGMRYRARYVAPDGTEKSKSFPDGEKRKAEDWMSRIQSDMSQGQYIDPRKSRITFQEYAAKWLAGQMTDPVTRYSQEIALRLHVNPYIGARSVGTFLPGHIRDWTHQVEQKGLSGGYRRDIFAVARAVFSAAVDDNLLPRNPCSARTVTQPRATAKRISPWHPDRVFAVRAAMPEKYRAMVDVGSGEGLRQGEIFGLALDALNTRHGTLHVLRQVKRIAGTTVFAPPKGGKFRDVPLAPAVAESLARHMDEFPPVDVTLPWLVPGGELVTHRLLFVNDTGAGAVYRANFNNYVWKPALAAAGVISMREEGQRWYASAREHGMHALRHFYAAVLLDAGENIKALSEYMGHHDPGFTLRFYGHLMPTSEARTRQAVDDVFRAAGLIGTGADGPETAQAV